ncbi:hybrid sensor histidine kinase/response regulator transcription factor [Chitinophaga rhizophila]|uniref:hybrid sensor histidine kinase/response regulator transcription factor n=1 Tax=Chitinophaga rhizophila TaxID=2866212 RepID=UPI00293D2537|nr:two-component regulator propeller domain-containing protein [Chitinophaga rhizophila]
MNIKQLILLLLVCLPMWLKGQSISSQYQLTRIDITQGLSGNQVNCLLKDSQGFMWFGTMSGLNRFDGYNFKVFRQDISDSASLSDNFITHLMEGPEGLLWITHRNGQNIYHPESGKFERNVRPTLQRYGIPGDSVSQIMQDNTGTYWFVLPKNGLFTYNPTTNKARKIALQNSGPVAAVAQDPSGHIWILLANGYLQELDARTYLPMFHTALPSQNGRSNQQEYQMMADNDGDLWIINNTDLQGIYYYQQRTASFTHYNQNTGALRLNNNIVRGVVQDNKGLIWIGTDHGGINIIDKNRQTIEYLTSNSENPKSLSQNSINALYRDNTGIIWIGTYKKGICYYHENIVKFPLYQHETFTTNTLPYNDVNRFVEDAAGNLWIGTNGGGLIYYDRTRNTYRQYLHNAGNPNSPSSNVIVSLWIDKQEKLWIGSYFGGLDCFDGNKFTHYKHNPADPASLSDNSVWEIFEDSKQRLWVGTLSGGLNILDRATGSFRHFANGAPNSIRSPYVSALLEDKAGNIWIGTADGVDVMSNDGRFTHYSSIDKQAGGLSNRNVICLFEDSRGLIWIGTHEGLNVYDPITRKITILRKEHGLPDNTVLNILEDSDSTLWMSTTNGIINLALLQRGPVFKISCKQYDESDGLQGREFNENAALKTRKGEIIFGGGNGFNIFYPHQIAVNTTIPPVVFTDFQIFNKSILPGEMLNGHQLLEQSITHTKQITLKYRENVFSISFAALNYFHPEKNQYAYQLEGFNSDWLTTDGAVRKATYTNLDPGEYIFRVKASNNDGIWTTTPLELHITILPPFWKTPLAFILYALMIIGALILARRVVLERERLRSRIEQEKQEAQRIHELDALKIRFFTNISHEFRTPLSLIITPLEKMISKGVESNIQQQLVLVQRNARRLLNLVNQLLDFRKMEVQEIKLHTTEGEIVSFIRELTTSFSDLSEKKQIHLDFHSSVKELHMQYDPDKIEKIIFNLLSNAFKFTPEHGNISVDVQLQHGAMLAIMVKDNGIGIPGEQQERIFERFFQHDIPGSLVNQGSGIGLSITREFVKLHGGTISVDSAPGMGSTFIILLPVRGLTQEPVTTPTVSTNILSAAVPADKAPAPYAGKKPVLLLVEDNEDFRFYLKDNLGMHFHIVDAANGKQGWELLQGTVPNLVVSDVNMPEMDGLELCRRIRQQQKLAHLPVILLTARASEEDQLEALDNGATDYITKPFNYEVLLSRLRNITSQQVSLKKTFQQHIEAHPEEIAISSQDELFLQQALQIVEKNISNPDFSVEELSRELHMSRVSAYKKLLSITGKTPLEFIRSIRLKRAAQLLGKSQLTIAEVAYEVGFNNPKYFAKYFKLEYGVLPSAYKNT